MVRTPEFKAIPIWLVVVISWLIAFVEYCFQVPANRIGHTVFSAAQLKTIQEIITLLVFCFFSVFYLNEHIRWNYIAGFFLSCSPGFLFSINGMHERLCKDPF
ncbi:MAG: DMT family protein [Spirochaetales bacterium]|nr:DMT family protein [Spirochaetales bacterium]